MRKALGLDESIIIQYIKFIKGIFMGDFGISIVSRRAVLDEFLDRFPATLELGAAAMVFATLMGATLGILSALRQNSLWDYGAMSLALVGYSMPIFWWGLLLILFFSVYLGWTPVSGRISVIYEVPVMSGFHAVDVPWAWIQGKLPFSALGDALRHLVLPAIAVGTIPLAALARMTRSSLLEVLRQDYVRTARAKGLRAWRVWMFHALRNALIPIITVMGLMFGTLLTGAILTETIFSWPGIGKWMVHSVMARDYPVVQGGVVLIAFFVVGVNVATDFLYGWLQPKMRGLS
jgi:dipeptide transport system permease protein